MLSSVRKHSMPGILALMMLQVLFNVILASQGSMVYMEML